MTEKKIEKGADRLPARLLQAFEERFGAGGETFGYFVPGRVNLIGEHTDYNGGCVLPCALALGTYAAVRARKDRRIRLFSENRAEEGIFETDPEAPDPGPRGGWTDYPMGVLDALQKRGFVPPRGLDAAFFGTIPAGAGLSSSASLEVLCAFLLRDLFGFPFDDRELALLCREAENDYVGTSCGIMDQFAVTFGKKDCALFLDTDTLAFSRVPLRLAGCSLVIANTNVKHSLRSSAYNDRRRECAAALEQLQKAGPVRSLCGLSPERFGELSGCLEDPVLLRRARHAVLENARVQAAAEALSAGDAARFGRLMNESHRSLAEDYEVTGPELDALAAAAQKQPGCLGSRMTGGGFGGCTVSLVKTAALPAFRAAVCEEYREKTGLEPSFYPAETADGPRRLL